jgi:mannose-1-phosphate guanylyltransferase
MKPNVFAVIMAGGGGTRLWPLSRVSRPKQMLPLIEERTLFQVAVQRLRSLFPPERILVVTGADHAAELKAQAPELLSGNFLLEPQPRGTAAAIGLATAFLRAAYPGATMVVLTADHYIGDEAGFHACLEAAVQLAELGKLVTLGIHPEYAATQYGYIHMGKSLGTFSGLPAFEVVRFKEKPSQAEAEKLVADGEHAWNSGMFIWKADQIADEFKKHMPDLYAVLEKVEKAWGSAAQQKTLDNEWPRLATQTIDYGVMENAKNVAVIPGKELGWNDVGSWTSLFDVLKPDGQGNVVVHRQHFDLDSWNSLVHSNEQERMIVTVGVHDLVVVDTGDVLLICSRDRAQDIRKVIELLKEKGLQRYL